MSTNLTPCSPAETSAAVWVRVFHNNHPREAFLSGYQPGHTVIEVFTYAVRPKGAVHDHIVAEEAFTLFNIGDDPAFGIPDPRAMDYRARGNRSLSTGDVIAIDGRFHSCDPAGWRELPEAPPVEQITSPGTTPLY